jgi:hypothetical protein
MATQEQKSLCPNCFGIVSIGDKFCGQCGIQLDWAGGKTPAVDMRHPIPTELLLLLIRPSLRKIFESPTDDSVIDADVIQTGSGYYDVKGVNKHFLQQLPILSVSETESVGYAFPTRLDLIDSIKDIVSQVKPPVVHPLDVFSNRDVMIISEGSYNVQLFQNPSAEVQKILKRRTGMRTGYFRTCRIIYVCSTVNQTAMNDLRTLESTAQRLLDSMSPDATAMPKLPTEIVSGWYHDFLDPIFKRAKEIGNK